MKKLLIFALLLVAAWQAWKHYPDLRQRRPAHEAEVRNGSDRIVRRLRLTVDGQTFVSERLQSGESAAFPFRVNHDASFRMLWEWDDGAEQSWKGGMVPKGPMVQRHTLIVQGDGGVIYHAAHKVGPSQKASP